MNLLAIVMRLKCILIAFLFFSLVSCQTVKQKELERADYGISYPENYLFDEAGENGTSFVLKIPNTVPTADFVSNINLIVQDLDGLNLDLKGFVALTESQVKAVGQLINSKQMKVDKTTFHSLMFEGNINGADLKFLQYDYVKDNKAYVLTYTAKKDEFDKDFTEAKRVMDSFYLN